MYYVVIPAYQPDEKLIQLLEIMKNRLNCQVIVVDDGRAHPKIFLKSPKPMQLFYTMMSTKEKAKPYGLPLVLSKI